MSTFVDVAVIGAGPAGLMAAETAAGRGAKVTVYESMPSAGRKLLVAGASGLNLTHSEPFETFVTRYGASRARLEPSLRAFGPSELRQWAASLGISTFVGSSGRVFPDQKTGAGLLRAWTDRLVEQGVEFHFGHRWTGWDEHHLTFETGDDRLVVTAQSTVLALGGASWPQTGSTGAWNELLQRRGVELSPFRPANCGFSVAWSPPFRAKFDGVPLKSVAVVDQGQTKPGELLITAKGIEGSLVYSFAAGLRDRLEKGPAVLTLDLAPDRSPARLAELWAQPRQGRSVSTHLEKSLGIRGVKAGLLREASWPEFPQDPVQLASLIKACPIVVTAPSPLETAISSAGGVRWSQVDDEFCLTRLGRVYCAGEMLDWEAPTGGYLLTACWSTGRAAGWHAAGPLRRA